MPRDQELNEEKAHLRIVYEIDGKVIKEINRDISKKEKWFWLGNSIWRGY